MPIAKIEKEMKEMKEIKAQMQSEIDKLKAAHEASEAETQRLQAMLDERQQKDAAAELQTPQPSNCSEISAQPICRVELVQETECTLLEDDVKIFDNIYEVNRWGGGDPLIKLHGNSLSGAGSSLRATVPTITYLDAVAEQFNITSIADIPCGDVNWQMGSKALNEADAYFGGDIASYVTVRNRRRFDAHMNKVFAQWDLAECRIPRWRKSCDNTEARPFDLVQLRDVLQHMAMNTHKKVLQNIVHADAAPRFLAITSYPTELLRLNQNYPNYRPVDDSSNKTKQLSPEEKACEGSNDYCGKGDRRGKELMNRFDFLCPPYNFPPPIFNRSSHPWAKREDVDWEEDIWMMWAVNDDLRRAVDALNVEHC